MMADLGVSRTMLREVLSSFETSGIIIPRQGSGRYPCIPDVSAHIVDMWSIVLRVDPAFMLDLLEIRSILEINSLPKAIEHVSVEQLKTLSALVQEMERLAKVGQTFVSQDRKFHLTIYESLHNLPLQQLVSAFWDLFQRAKLGIHHEALEETAHQHREMIEALTRKDLDRLASVTRRQLADARYRIVVALADCSKDIERPFAGARLTRFFKKPPRTRALRAAPGVINMQRGVYLSGFHGNPHFYLIWAFPRLLYYICYAIIFFGRGKARDQYKRLKEGPL
jgi:DNA-binding FadR family transcriptional regulator